MKKLISMLMLGTLPALVMASGEHAGDHHMHRGSGMEHGSHTMRSMNDHAHELPAGQPGNPDKVDRTITVLMNDTMRFEPAQMTFKSGETIHFVVRNTGRIRHEMVIGSVNELKEHAEMMKKMPDMPHEEPNMISLAPGEHGDLIWQFGNAGAFDFACLIPGHLEAGMSGRILVE